MSTPASPMLARLPDPTSPGGTWLGCRWRDVVGRVDQATPELGEWARAEVTCDPVGAALLDLYGWVGSEHSDPRTWDQVRAGPERVALGQWFTPPQISDLLASVALAAQAGWPSTRVLDPAAGGGSVLLAVARARRAAGWPVERVLASLEAWDRDPVAAWTCRAALVSWALSQPGRAVPAPLRVFGGIDALSTVGVAGQLLRRRGPYSGGFGAVVTNPPYLESKRMRRAEPGLKERLRQEFPQLRGAFDLYLAFCYRALAQAGEGGSAVLLVPNKVTQGRYAAAFRRQLLAADSGVELAELVDLSRMAPRPFPGTGVYPVVLHLRRTPEPPTEVLVRRVSSPDDLASRAGHRVSVASLRSVGGDAPLFVPFRRTWPDLEPLMGLERLGEIAAVVSTCSFHARGLREQFVTETEPPGPNVHPYLGGPSRARRTELTPFRTHWAGWYIRYDQQELREVHRNPLPSLQATFLKPKILFCQHGVRMRPVADPEGRWVSKDVYPVAWPLDERWPLWRLLAVLASTPFTALYNTLYQGIVCGGETYHYLPAFLKQVPVPPAGHPSLQGVGALARRLSEGEGPPDPQLWTELDRAVCSAYGLDEAARLRMVQTHLVRVGAEAPSPQ